MNIIDCVINIFWPIFVFLISNCGKTQYEYVLFHNTTISNIRDLNHLFLKVLNIENIWIILLGYSNEYLFKHFPPCLLRNGSSSKTFFSLDFSLIQLRRFHSYDAWAKEKNPNKRANAKTRVGTPRIS